MAMTEEALRQRLDEMARRYSALTDGMSDPAVLGDRNQMRALGREQAELEAPVERLPAPPERRGAARRGP